MEEKIDRAKSDYGVIAYGETRAAWMAELDLEWAEPKPVKKYQLNNQNIIDTTTTVTVRNERIMRKLKAHHHSQARSS